MVIENFFTDEELEPCRQEIATIVDKLANKLYNAGKIKGTCIPNTYIINILNSYSIRVKMPALCLISCF